MMELRNSKLESPSLDPSQPIQKTEGDGSKFVAAYGGGGGVKVDVGNAGGGAEVVKRKRGRPPRVQANQPAAKKSKEEDEEEDVCFICFDGGSLVLCDRRGCPKAYHPSCIKRDEAFFRSKAKWNCGWHICSICEKTAHHMCYTCTYSLCKGCIRTSDYVCVRGDKGFCTVCMKTIMLIENRGDATAQVDFDDKSSWEYLFKVYWVYLKGKLSLTLDELTQAKNPWKLASIEPIGSPISASGRRSITSDLAFANLEANESKRRKTNEQANGLPNDPSMDGPKEWASKELLDFVAHMNNGDASVLSQFDVQALLLEYIKRNNLRDPRKNTQIICDLRLMNLFGKPRVGHIEMLKLLEHHFLLKEDPLNSTTNTPAKQGDTNCKTENMVVVGNKERKNHRKGGKRITQNKLDEYAAIDVHNMNLIYLKRNLMESLIEDDEKFHEKAVGSIVQIRISGSDQKDDMYRLVQVVGTTKVDVPYKIGDKLVDVMLEVLNLDKKETVSIDTISNQELSEDECRRLRESIKCGLVRCFTVGEIQEKAVSLQSVLLDDRIETEMLRLNQLCDRASEKGQKKGVRECVRKLKILKTPEERERRLREIPEVHSDPKMNPDYESDDTEEYFNNEHGEHQKPKFPWVSGTNTTSPTRKADNLNDQPVDLGVANVDKDSSKSNMGKDAIGLSGLERPQNEAGCNGSTVPECDPEAVVSSSLSNIASDSAPSFLSTMNNQSVDDDMWHYRDPSGNVQGPFAMVQLQKWSTSGYFPADMRIWTSQEADSLLLNHVLQERFHNYGRLPENIACNSKDDNQVESDNVCSEVPSSTILTTSHALDNSVNLEKIPNDLNCDPPSVASLTNMNKSAEQIGIQNMPDINQHDSSVFPVADAVLVHAQSPLQKKESHENQKLQASEDHEQSKLLVQDSGIQNMPDINQHVSSVFTVADAALVDLPSPLQKKENHENQKIQDSGFAKPVTEQSKPLVHDSGNPPSWSTTLSLVVGGTQLPETGNEWGRYPPTVEHQVATTNTTIDPITHVPSWHGLGETIEFSTLAEESVSDLLAEVDAMESRNCVPSPTSRRNSFLEDLFNGSIDDFSPTADQGTRSDGFSSTADIHLSRQSTGIQFSFGLETKPTCPVSIPQTSDSENIGFKWADMGSSELHPSRQDMIDLNDSTRAEADDGEKETVIEEKMTTGPVVMAETQLGSKSKERESESIKAKIAGAKIVRGFPEVEEEEGEFIQPETAPPQLPPLLPLPQQPPPPPLTVGLDAGDLRKVGSGRPSQGTTSTGRVHTHTSGSRSGNVGRDSHHRRSGGDRYNSNSPRERSLHVEDSGYSRSSKASWSRQSSFGAGSGSGSSGGYSRPPLKGQRVCKFYETGRCKKGSACNYLHPQDR